VISDDRMNQSDSTWADIKSISDYYPFGLAMEGRTNGAYRYGFNGKEKDPNEEWGGNSHYDYGFRIYNPEIAKFLSVDPLTSQYAELTPYQYASNKPINSIDLDGLESRTSIKGEFVDGMWTLGSDNHISLVNDTELIIQAEIARRMNPIAPNYGTLRNNDITSTPQYKMFEYNVNTYGDFVLPIDVSKRLIRGEEVAAWEIGIEVAGFIPFGKFIGKGGSALIEGAIKVWKNGEEILETAYKFGNLGHKGTKQYNEAISAVKKGGNFVAETKEQALEILNSSFKNIPDETHKKASRFGYRIDKAAETGKDGLKQGHQGTHINYYDKETGIKGTILIEQPG
jgi:RHS repeat-associated protein